jgi:hypothetical protein
MRSNRLQLSVYKTDQLWFTTPRRQSRQPTGTISLGSYDIMPSSSARNLGVFIDYDLNLRRHIDVIVSCCLPFLRQLHSVRRCVVIPILQWRVTSLHYI